MDKFTSFTQQVSRLNKLLTQVKAEGMQPLGLKAVHAQLVYQLHFSPNQNFSDLKKICDSDAALISRSLKDLVASGEVLREGDAAKYNATYSLSKKGEDAFAHVQSITESVISQADKGISDAELATFYSVLTRLITNFENMNIAHTIVEES